jgi:membrane protein YqaA with SNARE-associated domain
MTTLAQHRSTVTAPFVAVALAISVLGGIVGGAVAVTIPSVIEARAADDRTQAETAKWQKYGQEWEARYRQMYPTLD